MRKVAIILATVFLIPAGASAWFATVIDTVETRYPNGQLREQYQRVVFTGHGDMPIKHGFYRTWYQNGQAEWDGKYAESLKTQTWIRWDSTGNRLEEISYQRGLKDGMEFTWNPNGTLKTALCYRDDKFHGLCTWYTSTNSINGEYNNPCLSVTAERFYVDGSMLLPIQTETDKPCLDGLIGGREPYHNTEQDVWIEWDQDNLHFYIGRQIDSKKHGVWILWSAAGDMERVDVFDHGQQLTF
jgi:hypothetical protein